MTKGDTRSGQSELRTARRQSRGLFASVFAFSVFVNLLMLTGPIFMLQVYDRVLGSRSEATLVALFGLMAFMFLMMGVLDYVRGRVMTRIGARFQETLDRRVFTAAMRKLALMPNDPLAAAAQRDLESVQRLLASPVFLALFDIPWTPLFLAAIFVFHPWLGWLAIFSGVLLIVVSLLNQSSTRKPMSESSQTATMAERYADQIKTEAELIQSLGMRGASFDRWQQARGRALRGAVDVSDTGGLYTTLSKTLRQFLQSAMLGLGAYLVLQGALTPGAMIAGSILMGRALAPIEMAVGQWALVQRAQEGWGRLSQLLSQVPPEPTRTALPKPRALLEAQQITVVPPW